MSSAHADLACRKFWHRGQGVKVNGAVGGVVILAARRDAGWVGSTVGLRYNRPFAGNWRFKLRGDIGRFGVGSDLTIHVLTSFRRRASDRVVVVLGYR